jgi:hypothetical protein
MFGRIGTGGSGLRIQPAGREFDIRDIKDDTLLFVVFVECRESRLANFEPRHEGFVEALVGVLLLVGDTSSSALMPLKASLRGVRLLVVDCGRLPSNRVSGCALSPSEATDIVRNGWKAVAATGMPSPLIPVSPVASDSRFGS